MKHGFSLVELSIVLVILGLLTGGILTGQTLIRAAELRAVTTEFQRYQSAVNTFRDKYFALPGDMRNATDFWEVFSNGGCPTGSGVGTETCNGNGNGIIEQPGGANQAGEMFTFWQQLANAGLIEGQYTGITGSGGAAHATADNVPQSKMTSGAWFSYNWNNTFSGISSAFDGTYTENSLQFGGFSASGSPATSILRPEEAWNIDTKMDDGKPAYGMMRERFWDDCTTAIASSNLDADYLLTETAAVCTPFFYGPF